MQTIYDIVPAELHKYIGMRPAVEDQWHRAHMLSFTSVTQLLAAACTPFGQMVRNTLMLNDETRDLIYGRGTFGQWDEPYKPGSRPLLERYVACHTDDSMSDREKVIALNQSTSNLHKQFGRVPEFLYGEDDEQTILKGAGHCTCQAKLLTALCQVIGLQARCMLMWMGPHPDNVEKAVGGHTVTEVLLDGKWCFFDPSNHWYLIRKDGSMPSVAELRDEPAMLDEMSLQQWQAIDPQNRGHADPVAHLRETYFQNYLHLAVPLHAALHHVNGDWTPHWTFAGPEFVKKRDEDWDAIKAIVFDLARKGELTDAIYQLDIEAFRAKFGMTDANLHPPVNPLAPRPQAASV